MITTRVPTNLIVARLASDIVKKQNALASVQEQISTGKKVNRPSDAPAASAHLLTMRETVSRLDQYTKNASVAESQLSLEEGALAGTTAALTRVRDLSIRANGGLVSGEFRDAITSEMKLKLDELYTLANSRDSFGNYLFSGSNITQKPFSGESPTSYAGSDESNNMEIALGRTIKMSDPGIDVFMRVRSGNGDFAVSADVANTGTGTIGRGSVTDSSLFRGAEYAINFTSTTTYDITDVASGTPVLTAQAYEEGGKIEFDGMSLGITGEPQTGDIFKIEPSPYKDVFSAVADVIEAISRNPLTPADTARMRADLDTAFNDIDNSLNHVNAVRARVGTRLNSIDSSREENENLALQIERTKTNVEDVDIADAVTRLQMQANSLEVIQKSFSRIEGLSLFNYM